MPKSIIVMRLYDMYDISPVNVLLTISWIVLDLWLVGLASTP